MKKMKKLVLFLPLVLLLVVVIFLVMRLNKPSAIAPSEDWQGKPFPEFNLPSLLEPHISLSKSQLPKAPFILNVWASWCTWCIKEFPVLLEFKQQGVPIVGLTYVDRPDDARNALQKWGNPFAFVIDDSEHDFLLKTLNISSVPATYLVDQHGVIRYQQKGYSPSFQQDLILHLDKLRNENLDKESR